MTDFVGYSYNPPASYLPRVGVQVATVSVSTHLRRLPSSKMLDIGGMGASGSRGSDLVYHVHKRVVLHPRCRIRIRSPTRSMA
jgi:hypothetical protein